MNETNPIVEATRRDRRALLVSIGVVVGTSALGGGAWAVFHEPSYTEQREAEAKEFGAIAAAAETVESPFGDPVEGRGRKVLVVNHGAPDQDLDGVPADALAKKASEVGLVVIAKTVDGKSGVDDGAEPFGPNATYRAVTWPERRVVGTLSVACVTSSDCFFDSPTAAQFVIDVRAGDAPRTHDKDPKLDALLERNARFLSVTRPSTKLDLAKLPHGVAPDKPKFVFVNRGAPAQDWIDDDSLRAAQPEDVNAIATWRKDGVRIDFYAFTPGAAPQVIGHRSTRCPTSGECAPTKGDLWRFLAGIGKSDEGD